MITLRKKTLTSESRNKLSGSSFVFPEDRRYPIHDESHARNALSRVAQHGTSDEQAKVRAAVHRKYPNIGKQEKAEGLQIEVDIWKAEREGKVYGVVLEPDLEDSQGDAVTPEYIERACHEFMVQSRKADVQHDGDIADVDLIENYIAPMDMELAGEPITKSSWIQAWQINDPDIRGKVERKELTGLSIAGSAIRVPA